jgi:signal transduction histidine kinase
MTRFPHREGVTAPYTPDMSKKRANRPANVGGRTIDVVVIGGLLVADLAGQVVVRAGGHATSPPLGVGPFLVAVVCAGIFWWRRQRPLLVLIAVLATTVLAGGVVAPGLLTQHTGVPLALAAYAAGSWASKRARSMATSAAVLAVAFAGVSAHATVINAAAVSLVVVALPWVAGQAARSRRFYLEQVESRLAEAERDRDARTERAVLEERRHIARELHDVVAHHVSLIGVQAGAARIALDAAPDGTREALLAIERSSRSAVAEMRQLLDVLRSDGTPEQLEPQPGLGSLEGLVAGFRDAGLQVTLRVSGDPGGLSPVLDLCCYRIVEEALTNVARHSVAAAALVDVRAGHLYQGVPRRILIAIHDPGPARPAGPDGGQGLIGMRERVALFGGVLSAATTPEGGFTVSADICESEQM